MTAACRSVEVRVSLRVLRSNAERIIDRTASDGVSVMAMVKGDAYGHGAIPVARVLADAGVSWLGVSTIGEALSLRRAGVRARVMAPVFTVDGNLAEGIAHGVDLSISTPETLDLVTRAARVARQVARVHVEVDVGLSRGGVRFDQCLPFVNALTEASRSGHVELVSMWAQLSHGDVDGHPLVDAESRRLLGAAALAERAGLHPAVHAAASQLILARSDLHFALVRPGNAIYGLMPDDKCTRLGLEPAMSVHSKIVLTKRIHAGEGVSYSHSWRARRPTTLALVPVGFADGIPRALSGGIRISVAGVSRAVVGNIAMDYLVADCEDGPAEVGQDVTLVGSHARDEPTFADWARVIDTVPEEIATSVGRLAPKVYTWD